MDTGFMSWLDLRCTDGGTLVCPVRTLWDDYLAFCVGFDFGQVAPEEFTRLLRGLPGVDLVEGGHGRRRRCATGIGLLPLQQEDKRWSCR